MNQTENCPKEYSPESNVCQEFDYIDSSRIVRAAKFLRILDILNCVFFGQRFVNMDQTPRSYADINWLICPQSTVYTRVSDLSQKLIHKEQCCLIKDVDLLNLWHPQIFKDSVSLLSISHMYIKFYPYGILFLNQSILISINLFVQLCPYRAAADSRAGIGIVSEMKL